MRIILIACAIAACGPAASTVRGRDGRPLPTHAQLDDDHPATRIHCPDGYTYSIVESRSRSIAGWRITTPTPVTDTTALCARIYRY